MEQLDKEYWDKRYADQQTGWDIGYPSTPLKEYIDQLSNKDLAILVPGCGNAYEAEYLLSQGFTNVTLLDFSPLAIEQVRKKLEKYPAEYYHLKCENFFDHHGIYDLVLEQTFFCAIDPALRKFYADKIYSNLQVSGKLAGVLFNKDFENPGPPFGGNLEEYQQVFSPLFNIIKMEQAYNSIAPRAGNELFIILQRK